MKFSIKYEAVFAGLAAFFLQVQGATYNLTVDAAQRTQPWNRFYEECIATCHAYTVINSYWGVGIGAALKFAHDSAGFRYWRGHGILDSDVNLVKAATASTLTLDWTLFDSVYNVALRAGIRPILEISCTPPALASSLTYVSSSSYNGAPPIKAPPTKYGWGPWENLMDSIVRHCEAKWGVEEVRNNWYFEVWNEPEWWYMGFPQPYLSLYDHTTYGLKKGDSLVRVGGSAAQGNRVFTSDVSPANFPALLNHCRTGYDSATGKTGTAKIDFLSWHWYSNNSLPTLGVTGAILNANNISQAWKIYTDSLRSSKYNWFKGPVMNNEVGPTSTGGGQPCRDRHQTASYLAKMIHLLNENGPNYPPPMMLGYWTLSDVYEEGGITDGSNRAFCRNGNYGLMLRGAANYAPSQAIPKPGFQAYRLLHKLGDFEVKSAGGTTNDGVNLVATVDSANSSIQVMVYSHFTSTTQSSAPTDNINLTINNIPWAPGRVRIQNFLVDTTHSNTYTKWVSMGRPANPNSAALWDEIKAAGDLYNTVSTQELAAATSPVTLTLTMNYFSVALLVLTNPDAVPVKQPADVAKRALPVAISADIRDGKLTMNFAEEGVYSVRLFSTDGKKVFESSRPCAGAAIFAVPASLQGTFVLQCRGPRNSLVKHILLKP